MKAGYKMLAAFGCLYIGQTVAGVISEPFAGASDYSIVVSGDANLGSGVHIHGGAYIGGNLSIGGGNTSVGSHPDSEAGLYVGGSILSSQRIDLMNDDYRVVGSNAATFQNAGNALASSPMDGVNVAAALQSKASQLGALANTGVTVNASDWNQVHLGLTADTVNVINWNSTNAAFLASGNTNLMFENFTNDTLVIINYSFADAFTFAAKNQNLPSFAFDNVIWNFLGDDELSVANSVSTFKGSILASQSNVNWQANDIDGQLLSAGLNWQQTSQSHYYVPWQDEPETEVSEPALMFLFPVVALGFMRRRKHA